MINHFQPPDWPAGAQRLQLQTQSHLHHGCCRAEVNLKLNEPFSYLCFRRKRKIEFENQTLDDSFEAFSQRKRRYVEEPKFGRTSQLTIISFLKIVSVLDVFLNPEKKGQQV